MKNVKFSRMLCKALATGDNLMLFYKYGHHAINCIRMYEAMPYLFGGMSKVEAITRLYMASKRYYQSTIILKLEGDLPYGETWEDVNKNMEEIISSMRSKKFIK